MLGMGYPYPLLHISSWILRNGKLYHTTQLELKAVSISSTKDGNTMFNMTKTDTKDSKTYIFI